MRNIFSNLGVNPPPDDPEADDALTAFAKRAYSQKQQERATSPIVEAARAALLSGGSADTNYTAPRATPTRAGFPTADLGYSSPEALPSEWSNSATVVPWSAVQATAADMGIAPEELMARLQRAGSTVSGFPGYGSAQAAAE